MKAIAIFSAAAAAFLALGISSASSQQACTKEYTACMNSCSSKPVKAVQDGCFQSCEMKNSTCAEGVYGKRPFNGVPSNAAEQKDPGADKDALAKTEKDVGPARAQAQMPVKKPQAQQLQRSPQGREQPRR